MLVEITKNEIELMILGGDFCTLLNKISNVCHSHEQMNKNIGDEEISNQWRKANRAIKNTITEISDLGFE